MPYLPHPYGTGSGLISRKVQFESEVRYQVLVDSIGVRLGLINPGKLRTRATGVFDSLIDYHGL